MTMRTRHTPDTGSWIPWRSRWTSWLLSIWVACRLGAQPCLTIEWDVTIGGSDVDLVESGVVLPDGSYLLVGSTSSPLGGEVSEPGYGLSDGWAVHLAADGTLLWERRYGGSWRDAFMDVALTDDGGFLFCGFTASPMSGLVSEPSFGVDDLWAVRTDALGNVLWDRRFGGTLVDEGVAVIARTDGSFLLAGNSESPVSGNKSAAPRGGYDYWVVAIDGAGVKLWDAGFGGSLSDRLHGMASAVPGGAVLTGNSYSGPSGDISELRRGTNDCWSLRLDASGNKLWEKRLGGSIQTIPNAGILNVGGDHFIAGYAIGAAGHDLFWPSLGVGDAFGLWVAGGSGVLTFETRAGGSDVDDARSIAAIDPSSSISDIALAGVTNSPVSGTITGIPRGHYDYWLTIQTVNNTVVDEFRCGTDQWDEVRKVLINPDGGYLLAGISGADAGWDKTHDSRGGDFDMWIVKVHPSGGASWYADTDGDGFGSPSVSVFACDPPPGHVRNDRDCDDTDPLKFSGAPCTGPGGVPDVLGPDCVCGSVVGGVSVPVVMGLQGPMDAFTGLMDDGLRLGGWLPAWEPYSQLGFTVTENPGAQLDPSVLQVGGVGAIVDHVLVELRDPQSPGSVLASRVGLLRRDGLVVQFDGTTPFSMDALPGWYHVAVRHRHHLGVMTAFPVEIGPQTPPAALAFTSPNLPVHGSEAMVAVGGTMCLWAGDANANGVVKYTGSGNDRDLILLDIGGAVPTATISGYLATDLDMDGVVKYTGAGNDRDRILLNIGGTVATSTRTAQLP